MVDPKKSAGSKRLGYQPLTEGYQPQNRVRTQAKTTPPPAPPGGTGRASSKAATKDT